MEASLSAFAANSGRERPISIHGMGKKLYNNTLDSADKEHMVHLLEMHLFFCATRMSF